jgi:hypothetical protein
LLVQTICCASPLLQCCCWCCCCCLCSCQWRSWQYVWAAVPLLLLLLLLLCYLQLQFPHCQLRNVDQHLQAAGVKRTRHCVNKRPAGAAAAAARRQPAGGWCLPARSIYVCLHMTPATFPYTHAQRYTKPSLIGTLLHNARNCCSDCPAPLTACLGGALCWTRGVRRRRTGWRQTAHARCRKTCKSSSGSII